MTGTSDEPPSDADLNLILVRWPPDPREIKYPPHERDMVNTIHRLVAEIRRQRCERHDLRAESTYQRTGLDLCPEQEVSRRRDVRCLHCTGACGGEHPHAKPAGPPGH